MSTYRITKLAQADLENIWAYTLNRWSLDQAESYIDGLFICFDQLGSSKAIAKDVSHIRTGYWRFSFNKHYVFYRIGDDDVVEIVRILHTSMNVEKHL